MAILVDRLMPIIIPKGYGAEMCGLCKGAGKGGLGGDTPCTPCDGSGKVIVLQPPLCCPRCQGTGKATSIDQATYYSELCVVCRGAGWVMTWVP